jgi:cation diffusion facilitator family transporter
MRWIREIRPKPNENRLYRAALIITLTGNLFLVIGKAIAAQLTGSAALYADAANSASDVAYSLLMVLGLMIAIQPPDLSHPQGHYRFEPFVGLLVTLSMAFAGYEAASTAIERFLSGGATIAPGLPTIILLTAAAIKGGMFLAIRNLATRLASPTLRTTAADNLSDVITSLAAFLGILGSQLHPLLDPIAGVIVSLWIFRAAFLAGRENIGFLTGAGASEEIRLQLVKTAEAIPGVDRVHHVMTDYVGPRLIVDMHINVNSEMSVRNAHAICDQVINALEALPDVDRAYVHIEPHDWTD